MSAFFKIASLVLFSALKFFLAPAAAVLAGYNFMETFMITSSGGVLGFLVFFRFGTYLHQLVLSLLKKPKKVKFSKRSRKLVKYKNQYGFFGIAILTPVLFGIPIGAVLAAAFFKQQRRTLAVFIAVILFWSSVLSYYSYYFKSQW